MCLRVRDCARKRLMMQVQISISLLDAACQQHDVIALADVTRCLACLRLRTCACGASRSTQYNMFMWQHTAAARL